MAFLGLTKGDYIIRSSFNDDAAAKSYEVCFDNAPQITLQIYTIMKEWNIDRYLWYSWWFISDKLILLLSNNNGSKVGLIVPSILQLAKSFTDTHFANVSDTGEDIPGFDNMSLWFPSFVFYLLHAMARSVTCAVLFLHFPHYASVMFVPQVIANMIIERYICGQKAIINNIRDQA